MKQSHLSVESTPFTHAPCVAFYSSLGFAVVAHQGREAWLKLPGPAADSLPLRISQKKTDAALDKPPKREDHQALLDALPSDPHGATLELEADSLDNIAEKLAAAGFAFVLHNLVPTQASLLALDPRGNLVRINNYSLTKKKLAARSMRYSAAPYPTHSLDDLSPQLDQFIPKETTATPETTASPSAIPKKIGILTSGGDSSGMNAAVRSVTRIALQRGCVPFAIHEGYEGLVEGGDLIKKLEWSDVRGFLGIGGTVIGTARCMSFRKREGRLKAAYNMIKHGIDALVVIGGDGSLTGADLLRGEWKGLVDELVATGRLQAEECAHLREYLTIVGLVGSIDNDMSSTDITIGAFTSLHRICESLDSLTSTAMSHQRAFVVEVMGRHCGWLALMSAISVGADWVFLPERPPPMDVAKYGTNWEDEMCEKLKENRKVGSRLTLVIICEGAIDQNLNPIKPEYVKSVLDTRLGFDTRVTQLGHVQRGGAPCAYDRYLATVQGVEAVEAVLRSTPDTPSPMIGIRENKITASPLMDAVRLTQSVAEAIGKKDFKKAMDLRDPEFTSTLNAYVESNMYGTGNMDCHIPEKQRMRIAIIHTGAPAGGMNTATRIAARLCLNRGHTPLAIRNGFSGLCRDEVTPLTWQEVIGWQSKGGSLLGTNRDHPQPIRGTNVPNLSDAYASSYIDCGTIAYHMQKHNIQGLMIIGGFEAYTSLVTLDAARGTYPAFCIPMVNLPATVSNNVPGTDFSLGSDTALNAIVEATDCIKLSASASQKRVFVVEVQGGNCGYLAVLGGLASGAFTCYTPESGITLDMLHRDVKHLTSLYQEEQSERQEINGEGRIIFRAEAASKTYTTQTISNILKCESQGLFDTRTTVLGHLQQGGVPSPLDRIRATRLSVNCVNWLQKAFVESVEAREALGKKEAGGVGEFMPGYTSKKEHACVIGIMGDNVVFTPVETLLEETDMDKRRGKHAWWIKLIRLIKVLSKYYYEPLDVEAEEEVGEVV
ncbi:6-phosphofructokinase, alpha subunit [Podochytrium sp. JEL0797]|nr:6-phosphofructokinase, alpha subunit [Podochytrium sp. JEL0797]